jgi:hypothetical protein
MVDLSVDGILAGEIQIEDREEAIDPGNYQFRVVIGNHGNASANFFTVTLEVIELYQTANKTVMMVNVTDLMPGMNTTIQFRSIRIRPQREYRIIATVDVKEKWIEGSTDNDDISIVVTVGEEPPVEPPWKESWVPFTGAGLALVISIILFLYLMRKKL